MAVATRPLRQPQPSQASSRDLLDLRDLPWWTPADQAELDVLVRALLLGVPWHQKRCRLVARALAAGLPAWCSHLTEAVEEIVSWRDAREAYSRAVWLRAQL